MIDLLSQQRPRSRLLRPRKNGDAHKVTQEPDSTINSNSKDTPKSKHSTTSKLTFTSLLVVALAALLAHLSGASSSDEVFFPPIAANAQYYSEATLDSRNNNNGSSYSGLLHAGVDELKAGLSNGDFSAVDLVRVYLVRSEEVKVKGPGLRAIIETSPVALEQARKLDAERSKGKIRGPLHGIPIVVKDNVATDASLGMNTTAGSYSLLNSIVPGDSPSISTLRKAGAIIVDKANMSVWAQARGLVNQTQGCSPRGGFGTSAYYPGGNPCSSSSGSAVAAASGLAVASVGSQTSRSIIGPASYSNIVGIKPTVGLVSRNGVIPISATQDSAGPFERTVKDVAHLLTSMAQKGRDEGDKATWVQPEKVRKGIDYANAKHFRHKNDRPLAGKRLGYTDEQFFVNATTQNLPKEVTDAYWKSIDTHCNLGAEMGEVTRLRAGNAG
ncbi:related to Amidase family protein [Ustilago bromivora]|uniref:Related to Amidase family protein n=1 Tax=Ustilago bromivora TaxID=307758 RepID=A0A1K0HC48_9BASI|nr:related to Amidase family protein [Ustilago bromivora]